MRPKDRNQITGAQSRAARAMLRWSAPELAEAANVGRTTVLSLESDEATPIPSTVAAIRQALEDGGIEFVDEIGVIDRRKERGIPIQSSTEKKSKKQMKSEGPTANKDASKAKGGQKTSS